MEILIQAVSQGSRYPAGMITYHFQELQGYVDIARSWYEGLIKFIARTKKSVDSKVAANGFRYKLCGVFNC